MEPSNAPYRQRSYDLDNIQWTPIFPSAICKAVELKNGGIDRMNIRTDPDNPGSEVYLEPGESTAIQCRQNPKIAIAYVMTTSSTGPLKVKEFTDGVP